VKQIGFPRFWTEMSRPWSVYLGVVVAARCWFLVLHQTPPWRPQSGRLSGQHNVRANRTLVKSCRGGQASLLFLTWPGANLRGACR
jgi:hypothetical protein